MFRGILPHGIVWMHLMDPANYKGCPTVTTSYDIMGRERHLSRCEQSACIL